MLPRLAVTVSLWTGVDPNSPDFDVTKAPQLLLGNLIRIGLFFAGILAVVFIIVGGFQYVTSAGNPQSLAKAKSTITLAVIGLIVSLSAFAIVNFVIDSLIK